MWVIKLAGLHYDTVSIKKQAISLFHILGKKIKKDTLQTVQLEKEKRKNMRANTINARVKQYRY